MKPAHEPEQADQTLLPGASAGEAPAAGAPPRAGKPATNGDTSAHPAASDATVDLPSSLQPPVDPNETLDHSANPIDVNGPTPHAGADATMLPSSVSNAGHTGAPGTLADASAASSATDAIDATMPAPTGATRASGTGGSRGPLGSDTGPVSISSIGLGGRAGASPSKTGTMVGRFALMDLHAAGGLGEVFKARDTELNREVAVKRIKSKYADDTSSRRRFLSEAQLTAKLDHPGVVPVFGLVNDVRGRPCYAMRFIRGETLKDEIDRYHGIQKTDSKEKTEKAGEKPPEAKTAEVPQLSPTATPEIPRTVAFRHLLTRFVATCQAIGYAHSRNIIHRDIKPANIMVGSFGETLVVDWGLAKSLDDGPDFDRMMRNAESAGLRHDPESTDMPSHMTMAGTAVGTPSYMAPEQAAGEIEKVGPRADIYALGATLFVILTGKAPVIGKTTIEVLDRVRRGEYEPAAKVNPEVPKPLDAIARKAMALRQENRYATALELAADVEKWLSDEPVSCYEYPFYERLARWARRNPARVATTVSLLIAGVLAAGLIAMTINEGKKAVQKERDRVIEEQKKTEAALDLVTKEQKKTEAALDLVSMEQVKTEDQRKQAVAARNVARDRYDKAVGAYNVLVTDIDKKLEGVPKMQELRKKLLENASEGLKQLVAGGGEGHIKADRTLVAAYRQMGDVYKIIGETGKARENFQKAVELSREVQRESIPADKRDADRNLALSLEKFADIQLRAGDSKAASDAVDEAIVIFTALAEDKNDANAQEDLARAKALRASIQTNRGNTKKALEDCKESLAARQTLTDAAPDNIQRKRDLAASLDALAGLQLQTGSTKEAVANAEKLLAIRKDVATKLPDHPDVQRELAGAYTRLGEVHLELGQMTKARNTYREGLSELKKLADDDEMNVITKSELAAMYGRLGQVQLRTGDIEEAVDNTKAGLDIAVKLQQDDPDSAKAKRDLALARAQYGDALLAAGRTDEGITEYTEAQSILQPLRNSDSDSTRAKLDLARTLERLGDGCMVKKDTAGAILAYDQSVKLRKEVKDKDAGSASARRELALGQYKLANAFCGQGKPGDADAYATEATNTFIELAAADPESAQTQRDIALAYAKWGQVLAAGGHTTGALLVWQSSLDRCETLAKVDAGNVQAKEDEAAAWERLAVFYASLGHTDRALAAARTAVDLWSAIFKGIDTKTKAGRQRLALAMLRCGDIYTEVRQLNAARDWYKKAAEEVKGDPMDPLLGPVAKFVADQQVFLDAVEAGLRNPAAVKEFPEGVRTRALRVVATLELRADHPVTADAVARQLSKIAKHPADIYAVAKIYAGCANTPRANDATRKAYAEDAVKYLKLAIDAGFHDASALSAPEWEAVRKHAPEFVKVRVAWEKKLKGEGK